MDFPELRERLLSAPVLCRFDRSEAEDLVRSARLRAFRPREYLWVAGDPIPGACFIASGVVRAYMDGPSSWRATYCLLWPREMPAASILQGREWISHAVAVSPVVLATMPFEPFHAACLRTPQQARQVLDDVLDRAGFRYAWEMHLRRLPLRRRLHKLFRRIARTVGTPTPEGILLDFPLTHQIAADLAWVKRDHAGRVLNEIAQDGLIIARPRFRWLIPDTERLRWRYHSR